MPRAKKHFLRATNQTQQKLLTGTFAEAGNPYGNPDIVRVRSQGDGGSLRAAAERFGVSARTLQRKSPTGANAPVGVKGEKLKGRKGKDGRKCKPPAKLDEISRAKNDS